MPDLPACPPPPAFALYSSTPLISPQAVGTKLRRRSDFAKKKILWEKEANLLLQSEIIKGYPGLAEFLTENPDLDDDQLGSLDPVLQHFFRDIFPEVLKQAASEWEPDYRNFRIDHSEDKSKWVNCSLCGTPNRYECRIRNTRNRLEMNVGSDCVEHFEIVKSTELNQLKRQERRLQRLTKLNEKYPGIQKKVEDWFGDLESQPFIIPDRLRRPYRELGERISRLYEAYLNGKAPEDFDEEFAHLLDQKEVLVRNITRWVNEHKNDILTPTRRVERWLKEHLTNDNEAALHQIRQDGRISILSLWRIEEPQLVGALVPTFSRILQPAGILVEKVDPNYRGRCGYVLKIPSRWGEIRLFCRHRDLAERYSDHIFGSPLGNIPTIEDVVSMSLHYQEESLEDIMQALIATALPGIAIREYDVDLDTATVFEECSGRYVEAPLREMAEKFKGLALGVPNGTHDNVAQWVAGLPKKRMTWEELRQARGASATMNRKWQTGKDTEEDKPKKAS